MSQRTSPPFRADHVGSLLRPRELLAARAGGTPPDELRALEDEAILGAIALQREAGLRTVTDGEFRRASWHMDFIYELGGIEKVVDSSLKLQFHNEQGDLEFAAPSLHVASRLGLEYTIFGDAFTYLREHAGPDQTPKLTIPSPSMVHYRGGRASMASPCGKTPGRSSGSRGRASSRPSRPSRAGSRARSRSWPTITRT